MRSDWALADKLAAWNERRLLRDLYDAYFLSSRLGATPHAAQLDSRLARIDSRHPSLKGRKKMTRGQFATELLETAEGLSDEMVREELGGVFPMAELAGLAVRIRAQMVKLAEGMR